MADEHAPQHEKHDITDHTLDSAVGSSAMLISACVMTSRITGFFRTWAMAFALGSTLLASSYQVANNLPNMLYELVVGGMIVTAFLPVYVSVKKKLGTKGGNEYASNLLGLTIIFLGIIALICTIFAPQLIYTQSFMSAQGEMSTSIFFFRFFAMQIVFYGVSAIISGVLNASRDYLWSSIAPAFNNIIVIITFVAYAIIAPTDPTLALYIIAIGNPLGVFIQMAMQIPALHRNGVKIRFHINLHDPALRETLAIGIPAIIVMATSFVIVSVQNAAAYRIADNGPSIIAYARLWFTLPYAFLAVPITTAMFTELSEMKADGDVAGFKAAIIKGTRQIVFLTVPFALYLIAFSVPLITLYHAGAFTEKDVSAVAFYLAALAISLPFYSVNTYLQKIFSSLREMHHFAIINLVCAGLQIWFTLFFSITVFGASEYALYMVALGESVFFISSDIICFLYLRKRYGSFGVRYIFLTAIRSLGLGLLGAIAGWAFIQFPFTALVGPITGNIVLSLVGVIIGGVIALALTFGIAIKLKLPGVQFIGDFTGKLKARFTKRA